MDLQKTRSETHRPSNRSDREAPTPNKLCRDKLKEKRRSTGLDLPKTTSGILVRDPFFQVFIKNPEGKSKIIWVKDTDSIKQMQEIIMQQLGYPIRIQNLIHGGRVLQGTKYLWEYRITPLSTIVLNLRLRGGASNNNKNPDRVGGSGTGSGKKPGIISFKNVLQGKNTEGAALNQTGMDARPYIVEQLENTPEYNIDTPEIDEKCTIYERQAIICKFNYCWPKPVELFIWIYTKWTTNCEVHLCSKGFFIVKFLSAIDRDIVMQEGPWFWGSTGLFITPWFPGFDANTMVVSKMPVWVRLHNLPIHLWN